VNAIGGNEVSAAHVSRFLALFRAVQPENSLHGKCVRHVLVAVENTGGLARLPVGRWYVMPRGRSNIFKVPLPIESIHLRHRRFDFVGLRRSFGLQAL
jgi:hypothetical protein